MAICWYFLHTLIYQEVFAVKLWVRSKYWASTTFTGTVHIQA